MLFCCNSEKSIAREGAENTLSKDEVLKTEIIFFC